MDPREKKINGIIGGFSWFFRGYWCPAIWLLEIFSWIIVRQISTLLDNSSPICEQHETLSLPMYGYFPTINRAFLDFLFQNRHVLEKSQQHPNMTDQNLAKFIGTPNVLEKKKPTLGATILVDGTEPFPTRERVAKKPSSYESVVRLRRRKGGSDEHHATY